MFDIVALGDTDVDLYVRVERLPGHDEKVPGDYAGVYGGGVAANFACAAARLGTKVGLISAVGDDSFGEISLRSLREHGVDTGGVSVLEGEPTYFSVIALDPSGEKALIIVRTEAFFLRWERIPPEYIERGKLLHIAPFGMEAAARAAAHASGAGIPVSVDLEPGMVGEGLDSVVPLLKHTRLLFPNELCIQALFGDVEVEEGARKLMEYGPEIVVVTRGAQGAFILTERESFSIPAYRVEVRDTTGAGDCFNAAFLSSWLRGEALPVCGQFAAAAAALSITEVGARGKLPARNEVEAFLEQRAESMSQPVELGSQ